jgi:hypothetical protein
MIEVGQKISIVQRYYPWGTSMPSRCVLGDQALRSKSGRSILVEPPHPVGCWALLHQGLSNLIVCVKSGYDLKAVGTPGFEDALSFSSPSLAFQGSAHSVMSKLGGSLWSNLCGQQLVGNL